MKTDADLALDLLEQVEAMHDFDHESWESWYQAVDALLRRSGRRPVSEDGSGDKTPQGGAQGDYEVTQDGRRDTVYHNVRRKIRDGRDVGWTVPNWLKGEK